MFESISEIQFKMSRALSQLSFHSGSEVDMQELNAETEGWVRLNDLVPNALYVKKIRPKSQLRIEPCRFANGITRNGKGLKNNRQNKTKPIWK